MVPPSSTRKTASLSPPSFWPVQAPEPRSKRTLPPSKEVPAGILFDEDKLEVFGGEGKVQEAARDSRAGEASTEEMKITSVTKESCIFFRKKLVAGVNKRW